MNLTLRRPERSDLDVVVDWLSDPAFRRFIYGDNERMKRQMGSQILAMLGGALTMPIATAGHFICDAENRGPVGLASVLDLSWRNRSCTVSTYNAQRHDAAAFYEGACFRIVEYAFDELNLHRVSARVDAADTLAQDAYARLGAVREVVYHRHALRDGSPCDVYGYGLLRADFDAIRAEGGRQQDRAEVSHGA